MDSEAYWAKRAEEREAAWQKKSRETLEKELAAYYEASLDHIQRDIDALYGRFAKDNALSPEEGRKLLTGKEYRTWRMSLEEYVAQIDSTGDRMLERELNTLAMRSRISRLDKLYSETLMELDGLGRKVRDRMDGLLGDAYKDNYYRGLYEIGHVGKALPAISQVDSKSVEAVLRTPWSGKNYSTRIWKNQKQLAQVIQDEVVASVHRGDDVRKISRRVAEKMDVGLSNAQRLVRTELNYVHNQAALDSIRDAEMDYFRFVATLDSRTSETCREHDGKIYAIDEADTGENVPPLHPRCRSIIVGSLGGSELKGRTRIAKGEDGKYIHVPAEMNYEDFQAVYVEKTQTVEEWNKAHAPKPKPEPKAVEVPAFEFVPAKSIEEAEAFAKVTFIGDGYSSTFKNAAVYKGISLDVANEINRTIAEIFDKLDIPKLNGIKVISSTSAQGKKVFKDGADAIAAYNSVEKGIFLNKNILKDAKAFAKHQEESHKAWDLVMSNIDRLKGLQRDLALLYKNAGRSLVDDSLAGVIRHEVGHHVQWNVLDAKANNAIGAKMKQYAPKISGYANAAKGEYLAESFAAYMRGETHLVDPEYIAALKSKVILRESAIIKATGETNAFTVNYALMNTKAYHDKFENLTERKAVSEAIYAEAIKVLNHRNGTPYEDIIALDARTGKLLKEYLLASGYDKFKTGFTVAQEKELETLGRGFEIIHNHPNSSLPSPEDLKGLFIRKSAVASTIICHDGMIYRITKLKHFDEVDELIKNVYNDIVSENPMWSRDRVAVNASRKIISILEKLGVIGYKVR